MKLKDGQISFSTHDEQAVYADLKVSAEHVMRLSGSRWNWPIVSTLSFATLQRILNLAWLYDQQIQSTGSILEFGVHYGSSLATLINLRSIKEPFNYGRCIYGFDTFEGFSSVSSFDAGSANKDFYIDENYEDFLNSILTAHETLAPKNNLRKFKLYKGDAIETVERFIEETPELIISMIIFDMDIYKPTKVVLDKLKPRLHQGTILVFDELNCKSFPGETLALLDSVGLNNCQLIQSPYLPFNTVCKLTS